jgi:hypothetical protein
MQLREDRAPGTLEESAIYELLGGLKWTNALFSEAKRRTASGRMRQTFAAPTDLD